LTFSAAARVLDWSGIFLATGWFGFDVFFCMVPLPGRPANGTIARRQPCHSRFS
jgi:hypothetical protein